MSSVSLLNTLVNLKMVGNASAQTASQGSKTLVCLFLRGGNDSYNMLVPSSPAEHQNYSIMRSNIALPNVGSPGGVLPLNRADSPKTPENNGRQFAVHPAMPEIQNLFDQGNIAFVANVGTLVAPTSLTAYQNEAVPLPQALFAHNSQIMEWHTSVPQGGAGSGWQGRIADLLNPASAGFNAGSVSMNISLAGNNTMQVGETTTYYTIGPDGSTGLDGLQASNLTFQGIRARNTKSIMEETYKNLYVDSFTKESRQSFELHEIFSAAFTSSSVSTIFPNTNLGRDLLGVARAIAAQTQLGQTRQTFFVEYGTFDHHADLLERQELMLGQLSEAVKSFWDALEELGISDEVTLFTASDFSRTLRSNGIGTDHAWGANHFVMGGAVDGQKIYGKYPDDSELKIGSGIDVGNNGRMLPTISTDEYFADLALWLGVPEADIGTVFPNLSNFWSGGEAPVGYFT